MDEELDPKKDYSHLSPEVVEKVHVPGTKPPAATPDDPSQSGHWSANPHETESEASANLPEAEPENMPSHTEVQTKTLWQRH